MKFRVSIVLALSLLSVLASSAQTDNTLYVRNFKGTDVGTKVTNAMASCNPSTVIPCILVIDPSLAAYPAGTMPTLCSHCSTIDYRNGAPGSVPPGWVCTGSGTSQTCTAPGNVGAASVSAPTVIDSGLAGQPCIGTGSAGLLQPGTCAGGLTVYTASPIAAPALGSNALPPASFYNMPSPTFYRRAVQVADCNGGATNVSNAATGIVATTSGTTGTCTILLPAPIDPTKLYRFAASLTYNDTGSNTTSVKLGSTAYTYAGGQLSVTAGSALVNTLTGVATSYGYLTATPTSTKMWLSDIGDGNTVTLCLLPDTYATVDSGQGSYSHAWDGGNYCEFMGAQAVDATYGPVTAELNEVVISTASVTNVVGTIYLSEGYIGGPTDGIGNPPGLMFLNTGLLQATTPTQVPTVVYAPVVAGELFINKTYGNPAGTDLVNYFHPNAYYNLNSVAYPSIAAFLNAGFSLVAEEFPGPSSCTVDALCSNWGALPGLTLRKKAVDYVRATLPAHRHIVAFGLSMGCINALDYEADWPGAAAIICISGVSGLQQAYNQTGAFTSFAPTIETAYSSLYSNIQAGTGQTPSSSPTYWSAVAPSPTAIGENFLSPNFSWQRAYAGGTAYTPTQLVGVARSDGSWPSALNTFDPYQNPARYANVPILLSYCDPSVSPGDTTINPTEDTNFYTAVTAAGGSVTKLNSTTSSCAHVTPDQFAPSTFVAFAQTAIANYARGQFGSAPPASPQLPCIFPSTCVTPQAFIMHANAAISTGAWTTALTFPTLQPGQNVAVDCELLYQMGYTSGGMSLRLSGFTGSNAFGAASMETNLASGVSTDWVALGVAASATLTFTGSSSVTATATIYKASLRATIENGNTAGTLVLQSQTPTATTGTLMAGSRCSMSPAQ